MIIDQLEFDFDQETRELRKILKMAISALELYADKNAYVYPRGPVMTRPARETLEVIKERLRSLDANKV